MSKTHSHETNQDAGARAVSSLDGFRALNPSDGLFLRAEHLSIMQSYAQSLAFAAARATGTGVVHGLAVSLSPDDSSLEITPGLAVGPDGHLLRLERTLTLPLDGEHVPARTTNGFWVVELRWSSGTSGSAPVYGSLCDDACSDGGRTIQPWRDEGVDVRLTPDSLPGLDATVSDVRRNWLASAYYERERAAGPPWLVPTGRDHQIEPLGTRSWDDGTALPADAGVPLAVLQDVGGDWVLDVWTARRLVDGPVAQATWRSRLAMRPWSVFLAQVLQLQEELAGAGSPLGKAAADPSRLVVLDVEVEEALREPVARFMREMESTPVARWHQFKELAKATRELGTHRGKVTAVRSLKGLGMIELPPAGYLAVDETQDGLLEVLEGFFGPQVDLRRCPVRADQVAAAVTDAQHRDRIPLDSDIGRPQVDVLVPVHGADKPELSVASYGWVAFVRRPPACGEAEIPEGQYDTVTVHVAWNSDEDPEEAYADGEIGGAEEVGTVVYPAGGWEYPGGEAAIEAAARVDDSGHLIAVVALAAAEERAPLAALRASLFVVSMDAGIGPAPVHVLVSATGEEAIVLVFRGQIR